MRRRPIVYLLGLILGTALLLRTYGLWRLVYANPDDALCSYFIVTTAQLSPWTLDPTQNALARILSWDYGYPLFVFDYLYVRALEALRLPVSEATLPLPLAVLGTLNCWLVFLIAERIGRFGRSEMTDSGNEMRNENGAGEGKADSGGNGGAAQGGDGKAGGPAVRGALIAAALMAVMPLTVGRSRSIGGAEACSGFLFLLAIWRVIRYLEQPDDRRRQWLAGLALGFYLCGDVQFILGGAILLALFVLWPETAQAPASRARGLLLPASSAAPLPKQTEGMWRAQREEWKRNLQRLCCLRVWLPPMLLFAPYIPAWIYAIHLGYPNQTYLGTVFAEHKADWGFHLFSFVRDLGHNTGFFPLFALPVLLPHFLRHWQRPQQWLLLWMAISAFPFLVAVTSRVTVASGYHEHLVAALAIALGLRLAALFEPSAVWPDRIFMRTGALFAALIVIGGAFLTTLGGVFLVAPFRPFWLTANAPYGALVPNSGMKAAGYWIREHLPRDAPIFVAHDPAVAYWYTGRECITGGAVPTAQRKQALLEKAAQIAAAVIPGQQELFPPALLQELGFRGRLRIYSGGQERLNIYLRSATYGTLHTEEYDRLYNARYRTCRDIIPPPWPYAPEKPLRFAH